MKKIKIFSKKFSKINNIQKENIIEYFISEKIENNKKVYGIFISELENKKVSDKNSIFISSDYNKVYDILKFLYENSIGVLEFKDIIKDIINELYVF